MFIKARLLAAMGTMLVPVTAQAAPELITNGNFSSTYSTGTESAVQPSQLNYNGYGVASWMSNPSNAYTFVFNPNLSGSSGYTSTGQYGDIQLYTSANGGSSTAPASLVSPVGGNFIASDGAFQTGSLSQTINGLAVGGTYGLTFYWAGAQQAGFTGTTTDSWSVTFGNQSVTTQTVTNPSAGFTPWTKAQFTFTPTATTQTLSFLANGGPSGAQAPFTLLDGVSLIQTAAPPVMSAVPEPATWGMMILGMGAVGFSMRRRKNVRTTVQFA